MPSKHETARLTEFQRQVCIGTLLGDSSLSRPKNGRNFHLSCYHSERQLDWLRLKHDWLAPHARPIQLCEYFDKRDGKIRRGGRFHTISAPCFNEFACALYPNGSKRITQAAASLISEPVALACLICDDGCWDHAGIQIATKQFPYKDNQILAERLKEVFGIEASLYHQGKYYHLRIPARFVPLAYDLCKQYVPETLQYKFGGPDYKPHIYCGKIKINCELCGAVCYDHASANRRFCSRACAEKCRPKGYGNRSKTIACLQCGGDFVQYIPAQKLCSDCRDKPWPHEKCDICEEPVKKKGRKYCSQRCSVIGCHRAQGHIITALA